MISFEEAIQIHELLIQKFGGSVGLRDQEHLKNRIYTQLLKKKQLQYWKVSLATNPFLMAIND